MRVCEQKKENKEKEILQEELIEKRKKGKRKSVLKFKCEKNGHKAVGVEKAKGGTVLDIIYDICRDALV